MAKLWLDELVQNISTQADTRAYDIIEKKNKQVIKSTNMLGISFNKAFKYLGAYFGIKALSNYTDEWKDIDSILRLVTDTDEQRLNLQSQLFQMSQKTRQEISGTVDLYRRITVATEKLGISEAERLKTTETINKALLIGGGSRASNMAALVQLGQGLSADALRGQELNSILEQSPRLAKALADGLNLQVGDLRKYAEKNRGIKAQQVMTAILSQSEVIDKEFGKVNLKISHSLTRLSNSIGRIITGVDKGIGGIDVNMGGVVSRAEEANSLTASIALGISKIAEYIDRSTTAVVAVIKYAKQLLILFLAIKALKFLSIPFDLLLLNLSEGVTLATAFKQVLQALNIKGLVAASWAMLGPWIKLLAVAIAIKEIIDTLRGKDTVLRNASEALGDNFNNRMARDYEDIFNTFGDGWGGKIAAVGATPLLMIKNGAQMGTEKVFSLPSRQVSGTASNTINVNQYITTNQPAEAAAMSVDGIRRFNMGG